MRKTPYQNTINYPGINAFNSLEIMKTKHLWKYVIMRIKLRLGYIYMVNMGASKEVHNLTKEHVNCHINDMTNYKQIRQKDLYKYIGKGWNGCRWCLKKFDKG